LLHADHIATQRCRAVADLYMLFVVTNCIYRYSRLSVSVSTVVIAFAQRCYYWSRQETKMHLRRTVTAYLLTYFISLYFLARGYRGGSPTAVQAWRTCPL